MYKRDTVAANQPNEAYRLRKQAAWVYGEPKPTVAKVFARDNGVCYLCGCHCSPQGAPMNDKRRPTVDHVVSLKAGGKNTMHNAKLACASCNSRKSCH